MQQTLNSQEIELSNQRDVASFIISGTIFSATFAGSMNFKKYRKKEITRTEAIQDTVKLASQGGMGTGCAVAAANAFGKGDYVNGLLAIGMGAVGVYGIEKISESVEKALKPKEKTPMEKWIKNDRKEAIKNAKVKTDE